MTKRLCLLAVVATVGCASPNSDPIRTPPDSAPSVDASDPQADAADTSQTQPMANVVSVAVQGNANAYTFSVGIRSDETGCAQYADWWEVVSTDGNLLYRRILAHSHVSEQPFVRSGGPVDIAADTVVWVRAHMNTGGYGQAKQGTPGGNFIDATPPDDFAASLETTPPLPSNCAF